MAYQVLYATGFEAGSNDFLTDNGWAYSPDGANAPSSAAPFVHRTLLGYGGNVCQYINSGWLSPDAGSTARWVNFSYYYGGPADRALYFLNSLLASQFTVRLSVTNQVQLFRGAVLVAASAAGAFPPSGRNWIAIYLKSDPVNGECRVFINGAPVTFGAPAPVSTLFTGNTALSGTAGWSRFAPGVVNTPGINNIGGMFAYIDDLVITDDDGGLITTTPPIPEVFGVPQTPNSVISGNLTPSVGLPANRWDNVNNINPIQTTDYNYASASGDGDLYGITSMLASPTAIWGVSSWVRAARDGAIANVELRVVSGASDTYGTPLVLPASPSYAVLNRSFAQNPNGAVAWNQASVNALQIGLRFT